MCIILCSFVDVYVSVGLFSISVYIQLRCFVPIISVHDPVWLSVKASNLGGLSGSVVRFNLAREGNICNMNVFRNMYFLILSSLLFVVCG